MKAKEQSTSEVYKSLADKKVKFRYNEKAEYEFTEDYGKYFKKGDVVALFEPYADVKYKGVTKKLRTLYKKPQKKR